MSVKRVFISVTIAVACAVVASQAGAQAYPSKPIRIFTNEAGGGNDFAARLIGQGISGPLGQAIVIENRPVLIAASTVAKAAPDGYTLLLGGAGMWLAPYLQKDPPWDPIRDFTPITMTSIAPSILVVHPSLPVKTVKELIAFAKARPGQLNYSSTTAGALPQLSAELLKSMAGVNIVNIPYKGSGPALNALIAGEVQVMFPSATAAVPHVKSGRLRALAITSEQRSTQMPDLPTVIESGLPGYQSATIIGMFAPGKTPADIITRLNQEIVRVLNRPEVKEKFLGVGVETSPSTPEQFDKVMKKDMTDLGKVIKDLGIHAE